MSPQFTLAIVVLLIGFFVFKTVRPWCRLVPRRRPWLILASVASIVLVVRLYPWINELGPGVGESPAGIFVILAKAIPLGLLFIAAVATILAAAIPFRPGRSDPSE